MSELGTAGCVERVVLAVRTLFARDHVGGEHAGLEQPAQNADSNPNPARAVLLIINDPRTMLEQQDSSPPQCRRTVLAGTQFR